MANYIPGMGHPKLNPKPKPTRVQGPKLEGLGSGFWVLGYRVLPKVKLQGMKKTENAGLRSVAEDADFGMRAASRMPGNYKAILYHILKTL